GQDAGDQIGVAVLLVSRDLAVPEVDHEGVVVVVASAVARQVFPLGLDDDDVAAVDQAGRDGGALGERAIQRPEDLVDYRLLADELAAPRAVTDGSPDDVVVA